MNEFHNDAIAMARVLVQYIPSNKRIQREIHASLNVLVGDCEISRLRSAYARSEQRRHIRDFDRSVVWMDERFENDMNKANQKFVSALLREKAA